MNPVNPPVCVDSTAVGITAHSAPVAEIIGNATVNEHLPKHEMSCIAKTRFILTSLNERGISASYLFGQIVSERLSYLDQFGW